MVANAKKVENGIWKYSKIIVSTLIVLFVISAAVDAFLWYKVQSRTAEQQSLNDLITSQKPLTSEDKKNLLDSPNTPQTGTNGQTQSVKEDLTSKNQTTYSLTAQQKIDLLNSLIKK